MHHHLKSQQRYVIATLFQNGYTRTKIAETIGVSPSTISREINRNSGSRGHYNWKTAQKNADYKKKRKLGNRGIAQEIKDEAIRLLVEEQWSPEQISAILKAQGMEISHETIYKIVRVDKKNGGELYKHCRYNLKHRTRSVSKSSSRICNRKNINERPIEANGLRFGDFEMDTIVGKGNHGAILTLTEKSTGMLFMRKLNKGKDSKELAKTVVRLLKPYKAFLKSITTDNGLEFAHHEYITKKLGVAVYFTDPYSSWQKGAIENQNGLIRQYIPKSTDFNTITHQFITKVANKINHRPRKKLNFLSPFECFYEKIL
ncbi:MAG: IS30 family transposase [Prevotella sp.]|nr:IS30 family transposase [Prevotella sp.]